MANEYGLDHKYFEKKLSLVVRDAERYTPAEMTNELARLTMVAASQDGMNTEIKFKQKKQCEHSSKYKRA